jgi:hypothetical protein
MNFRQIDNSPQTFIPIFQTGSTQIDAAADESSSEADRCWYFATGTSRAFRKLIKHAV